MARQRATMVEWMDKKGYGFARLPGGTDRIFVHVKDMATDSLRPQKGDEVELDIIAGRNGRPAGKNVKLLSQDEKSSQLPMHVVTAALLFIVVQLLVILGRAPFGILAIYVGMGGLSVYLYSRDKQAALFGWWRISERQLLTIDFLGGIIGGLLAQHRYRHKTSKQSYQLKIFTIVALHAALLAGLGAGVISADSLFAFLGRLLGAQ
jgi:uncharacterized membrane protein YsdA (DUF1294 family)/cold shock CspA family protein